MEEIHEIFLPYDLLISYYFDQRLRSGPLVRPHAYPNPQLHSHTNPYPHTHSHSHADIDEYPQRPTGPQRAMR